MSASIRFSKIFFAVLWIIFIFAIILFSGCVQKAKITPDITEFSNDADKDGISDSTPAAEEKKDESAGSSKNYTAPAPTQNVPKYVECPQVTVPIYFRFRGPALNASGVNTIIINDVDMNRFKFNDSWQLATDNTQLICKEISTLTESKNWEGPYSCSQFTVKRYIVDSQLTIKSLDYKKFNSFVLDVYDVRDEKDPLSGNLVKKSSIKLNSAKCVEWKPLT